MVRLGTFLFLSFQLYQMFSNILDYLPGPHNKIFSETDALKAFVSEELKVHQASVDPSSPRDFIDCFLSKMQEVRRRHTAPAHPQTPLRSGLLPFQSNADIRMTPSWAAGLCGGRTPAIPQTLPELELTALGLHTHQPLPAAVWTARPSSALTKTQGQLQSGLALLSLGSSWHSKDKQAARYCSVHSVKAGCSAQSWHCNVPDGCCTLAEKCYSSR